MTIFYINDNPVDVIYSFRFGRPNTFHEEGYPDELEIEAVFWEVTMPVKIPLTSPSWPELKTPPIPIRVDILPLLTPEQIEQLESDIYICETAPQEY